MTKLSETLSRLVEIKARAEAAEPGPWTASDQREYYDGPLWDVVGASDPRGVCGCGSEHGSLLCKTNAIFIAAARTDVPALAEALEEARSLLEAHAAVLRAHLPAWPPSEMLCDYYSAPGEEQTREAMMVLVAYYRAALGR